VGVFLEIERVIPPGRSGEAVQAELDAFARSLGVELERTIDTYDSLLRAAVAGCEPLEQLSRRRLAGALRTDDGSGRAVRICRWHGAP
jgi:hypothetical protein